MRFDIISTLKTIINKMSLIFTRIAKTAIQHSPIYFPCIMYQIFFHSEYKDKLKPYQVYLMSAYLAVF